MDLLSFPWVMWLPFPALPIVGGVAIEGPDPCHNIFTVFFYAKALPVIIHNHKNPTSVQIEEIEPLSILI